MYFKNRMEDLEKIVNIETIASASYLISYVVIH